MTDEPTPEFVESIRQIVRDALTGHCLCGRPIPSTASQCNACMVSTGLG